jgi:hypothetical protein
VTLWGCHSKPRADGYWVQDGTIVKGNLQLQLMRWHTDTSSRECQYRKATPDDPRCVGCSCP